MWKITFLSYLYKAYDVSFSYPHVLGWCLCPFWWTLHAHDWPPSLPSSPCSPLTLKVLLLSQGCASFLQSPKRSESWTEHHDGATKCICTSTFASWFSLSQNSNNGIICKKQAQHMFWEWSILTVSEVLSSRKLMALFTSSLQSWRATIHSSWVFPVTSISCESHSIGKKRRRRKQTQLSFKSRKIYPGDPENFFTHKIWTNITCLTLSSKSASFLS